MRIGLLAVWTMAAVAVAGCNRGPDPMSLVQSPAEFACRAAVSQASGAAARNLTTLAVAPTEAGNRVQIKASDGSFWTCVATDQGGIISVTQALMERPAGA
jgi:hypothetical protein